MFNGINNSMPANQLSNLPFSFFNQSINGQTPNRNNELNFNIPTNNPTQLLDINNSNNTLTNVPMAHLNFLGNLQKFYMNQSNEHQNSIVENFRKLISENKWDQTILNTIQCNSNVQPFNLLGNNSNLIFNNSLSTPFVSNNNSFDNISKNKIENISSAPVSHRRGHRSRGGTTQKTAKVWRFFDELTSSEEQAATCKICSKTIKATNSSTTGMIRHLRSCHHDEYQLLQEARLTSMLEKVGKLDDKNETIKSMFEDPSTAIVELQKQQQNDLKKNLIGNDSLIKLIAAKISAKNEPDSNKLIKKEENKLSSLVNKTNELNSSSPDNLKPVDESLDYTINSVKNVNIPLDLNLFPDLLKEDNENKNCLNQKRQRGNSLLYLSSTSNDTDEELFPEKRKYNKRCRKVGIFDESTKSCFLDNQNITNAILIWCSMDDIEPELLYRKGFINFIKNIIPNYELPELSQMKLLLRKVNENDLFSSQFHSANNLAQLPCIFNKNNNNIDNSIMHSPTATVTSVGTTSSTISNNGIPLTENYDIQYGNLSDSSPTFNSNDEDSEKTSSPEIVHDNLNNSVLINSVRNQYISNNFTHSIDLINERDQEKGGTDSESVSSVDSDVSNDERIHLFLKSLDNDQDTTSNFKLLKSILLITEFVKNNKEVSSLITNDQKNTSINESIHSKYTMKEIVKYLNILHSITFIVTHWEKLTLIGRTNCLPFEFSLSNKEAIHQIYEQIIE
ncbi:Zinc finger, BED-type predicted domain-containing protein [Strongyloides ratti]|uniref:Zinc finger, BED-type predicted domain-containing protein n=1 Tax=Strongyloides ratti TaxID=34506 RepID=A0A090KRZ3_STRRB|nr:Zinc finger, BED-type predicted domain-containing protein [Strongyloides ratti]CEF60150.1 Zinc finger, BED-type predicted domain-containing protein [Strongyloides ratti]